jgi:hypothetical protein
VLDPLLVPLDPDNERAALLALAVLLAPVSAADAGVGLTDEASPGTDRTEGTAMPTNDNHDSADNGQEGEADL